VANFLGHPVEIMTNCRCGRLWA